MNRVERVDQDFKLNSLRYWKPMKVFENRRNMVKSMSLGNDLLQSFEFSEVCSAE